MKVFNFFDSKAEAFSASPMFFETTGLAERAIEKSVMTPGSGFHENPADYTFYEIGTYDVKSGTVSMYEAKRALGTALEFKARKERQVQ